MESPMSLVRGVRLVLIFVCLLCGFGVCAEGAVPIQANHIRIHYFRPDGVYAGWTVYAFGDTTEDQGNFNGGPVQISGTDSFGAFFDVGITVGATSVGLIVHNGGNKDPDSGPGPDPHVNPSTQGIEFWHVSNTAGFFTSPPNVVNAKNPAIPANTAGVHYHRAANNYAHWTLYCFGDTTPDTSNFNGGPIQVTGMDDYGAFFDAPLSANPQNLGFIVHNIQTGTKDTPDDKHLNVALYNEVWIISGDPALYLTQPTPQQLLNGGFLKLQAFWIDRATILIQSAFTISGGKYFLASDPNANLQLTATGVTGGT